MRVLVNECLDLFSGAALFGFVCWRLITDANIASVGWRWQAWMRVLVDGCLDLCSGEALLGLVCWRLMLISPAWAGVRKLGYVCW